MPQRIASALRVDRGISTRHRKINICYVLPRDGNNEPSLRTPGLAAGFIHSTTLKVLWLIPEGFLIGSLAESL